MTILQMLTKKKKEKSKKFKAIILVLLMSKSQIFIVVPWIGQIYIYISSSSVFTKLSFLEKIVQPK